MLCTTMKALPVKEHFGENRTNGSEPRRCQPVIVPSVDCLLGVGFSCDSGAVVAVSISAQSPLICRPLETARTIQYNAVVAVAVDEVLL